MTTPGTQASKYDRLKQLIETSDPQTLKPALAAARRWSVEKQSLCVSVAARRGSAEALALVLGAGVTPQWQWKLWVNSATSAREPEAKIGQLLSLGLKPPAQALRIYAEDELTNVGDTDRVAPTALLLEAGADINARTDYGWTPLMIAVLKRDLAWVRQLVAAGADGSLGATSTNHPWYDDEYPVAVRVTPAEWARRQWKLSGKTDHAWLAIIEALEGSAAKRARARAAKARPFEVRWSCHAADAFKRLGDVTERELEDCCSLHHVAGSFDYAVRAFSARDAGTLAAAPPTPMLCVIEYDTAAIAPWRQAQEAAFCDVSEVLAALPCAELGMANTRGEASVAALGKHPGFVADVELEDRAGGVRFLLAAWPVSDGFAIAVVRPDQRHLMVDMLGIGAWPANTQDVEVELGD